MSKHRVGLLSLIVLLQASTLVGGYFGYAQISDRYYELRSLYTKLIAECKGVWITWGILPPSPFMFISLLVLFSMFLTMVLLADELKGRNC